MRVRAQHLHHALTPHKPTFSHTTQDGDILECIDIHERELTLEEAAANYAARKASEPGDMDADLDELYSQLG